MNVYRITFDWNYRTFEPVMDKQDRYDLDGKYGLGESLLDGWKPHSIQEITAKPIPHFFTTFSRAVLGITPAVLAVPSMRQRLEECGEFLPVSYGAETFWLLNCLNSVNGSLDLKLSDMTTYKSGRQSADRPIFKPGLDVKQWLFCIPESVVQTFATQSFFDFYHAHQLTGLEFNPQRLAPVAH